MKIPSAKFNKNDSPEFIRVLRQRVNDYFQEQNISRHADGRMVFKTVFMLALYFVPLLIMITGIVHSFWAMMALWVLMGMGMSGIGLSIMHDANHGSYSSNKYVNNVLGYLLNFLGGYHLNWKIQHNVLHHSYTNVHGLDEDIDNKLMRFSPDQEHKKMYRFQAFYAPFLYSLMSIYWYVSKDYAQLIRYRKKNLLAAQGISYKRAMAELIVNKTWYLALTLILPMVMLSLPWWQVLIGFLVMHLICGLTLALIFQPAHVVEETHFFQPDEQDSLENSWAIHQIRTTTNFAQNSRLFSWFIGGLNFQVEHHLFPNICHIHYRKLAPIVKKTAEEFGLPYYQHRTFLSALRSHFSLLHQLGTGKYDRKLAAVKA